MIYRQQLNCQKWQFQNIPEFTGGTMNPVFADCGSGLKEEENDSSFMHLFENTSFEDVKKYASVLTADGFEKIYEKSICGNLFYQFGTPEGLLYITFMKKYSTARIILDRCSQESTAGFGYDAFDNIRSNSAVAQYSLHYAEMLAGITCDCGMNYVFRLRDNSLIIIDGGEMEQSTDIAIEDYMNFLRELAGTKSGKMRIALWICTHAHNDHCDFFSKILLRHSDEIVLERAAFNFPNKDNTRHSDSVAIAKQRIAGNFPDVKYIKFHAGTVFNIANAKIEVLVSSEDTIAIEDEDGDLFPRTNSTSAIFKITVDGFSVLFLADCAEDNGSVLIDNYDNGTLDCDILQAAHHGINKIYDVYEKINSKAVFLPQCRMNMETRFPEIFAHLAERYGENNIILAHDETVIYNISGGKYTVSKRKHIGTAYDNSEW